MRSEDESRGAFVPDLSLSLGLVLTLFSVAMLVYFIHHLTQQLRVEPVLAEVEHDTLALIRSNLPETDHSRGDRATPEVPDGAVAIVARRAGYLQAVSMGALRRTAVERGSCCGCAPSSAPT